MKKRLHEFVISKKQRDLALASLSGAEAFKHWLVVNVSDCFCLWLAKDIMSNKINVAWDIKPNKVELNFN